MSLVNLEEDIKTLNQHESFARFIETIYSLREESIASLFESDKEQVQQLSGMILAYDQILKIVDWNGLQLKHMGRLNKDL
jgi:hypothetical protein|tara:strand:- start:1306 stop:1545 length:240 start_codon:yes stop_codon:yes gene_type:complete